MTSSLGWATRRAIQEYPLYQLVPGASKQGQQFVALCPFHDDHHLGNFGIFQKRDGWKYKCLSCGESGDSAAYLLKTGQAASFPEALKMLGIDNGRRAESPPHPAVPPVVAVPATPDKPPLLALPASAWRDPFHTLFDEYEHGEGKIIAELMKQQGFRDIETVVTFQLGYLRRAPLHEGAGKGDAWTLPLWPLPQYGDPIYVRTRNRQKDIEKGRRYRPLMTAAECKQYEQPAVLFWAVQSVVSSDLIICEGEFKAIASWELGMTAVGVPGAAVGARLLKEAADRGDLAAFNSIYVLFDNDQAGSAAAVKVAATLGREVKVMSWNL